MYVCISYLPRVLCMYECMYVCIYIMYMQAEFQRCGASPKSLPSHLPQELLAPFTARPGKMLPWPSMRRPYALRSRPVVLSMYIFCELSCVCMNVCMYGRPYIYTYVCTYVYVHICAAAVSMRCQNELRSRPVRLST